VAITLHEFGDRVGCDYTTASRLLSGDRMPSTRLLARICTAFKLDHGEALRTLEKDQLRADGLATGFAQYLKDQIFEGEVTDDLTPGHKE
jgi:transcriptional regulator with XRE-family HTH domain